MPLIDLKTDFKSLRFGQDRPGGGSSGQPFVQTPIPEQVNPGDTFQSINRGGSRQEIAAINDVDRINSFFNTAAGAQFIIKQNLLPYFSPVVDTNGKFLNTLEKFTEVNLLKNVYFPISTKIQVAGNGTGLHVSRYSGTTYTQQTGLDGNKPLLQTGLDAVESITGFNVSKTGDLYNRQQQFGLGNVGSNAKRERNQTQSGSLSTEDKEDLRVDEVNRTGIIKSDATQTLPGEEDLSFKDRVFSKVSSYFKKEGKDLLKTPEEVADKQVVKFFIEAINNDNPTKRDYIFFRAFINNLGDGFTSNWNPHNFVGRGENFYNYTGFTRNISLGFDIQVQSVKERAGIYEKLNYLMGLMTPDYAGSGYMRGNIVKLTIGDYLQAMPGIITGINFDIPTDYGWDLGREDSGKVVDVQAPTHIKVPSFNFTPIYNEIPRKGGAHIGVVNGPLLPTSLANE